MLTQEKTIGDFVAEDFRTAEVFKKYHIDFCCKGGRTIEEACEKKNINPEDLYKDLETVANRSTNSDIDFNSWRFRFIGGLCGENASPLCGRKNADDYSVLE